MKVRAVLLVIAVALGAVEAPSSGVPHPAFSVRVVDFTQSTLLGLPVMLFLEVRNVSGIDQALPRYSARLRVDVTSAPDGAWVWLKRDEHLGRETILKFKKAHLMVPPGWVMTTRRGFLPPVAGEYEVQVALHFRETSRKESLLGEEAEHWVGEVLTSTVTVKIREPQGIDAKAYQAVAALAPKHLRVSPAEHFRMVWYPGQPTGALDLLLTKFRGSTYTAYEVYRQFVAGFPVGTNEAYLSLYQRRASPDGLLEVKGKTWCDVQSQPQANRRTWAWLRGRDFVQCRDNWLNMALENHPAAWFADEMRLRLALDRYLLGDKDACAAGLEALAAQGRPYVASKAGELLAAMRAEGMLPGEGE